MSQLSSSITIYHGEHQISSRQAFIKELEQLTQKNIAISRLDGKKVSPEQLVQVLDGASLFGPNKRVALEGFITRLKSKDKTAIEQAIVASATPVFLWENKKLTTLQLKPFKGAKIFEFKFPPTIFNFLDSLGQGLAYSLKTLTTAIKTDSPGGVFYMLSRHIRLLIQVADPQSVMPTWQRAKLLKQLNIFSLAKILLLHKNLTLLDYRQKTGKSALSLEAELELLLGKLYH